MKFKPKIIGFICKWSLPKEVDIPRANTIHGYPKIRIVRVMCIGRVDPVIVLETFAKGADGVLVIGCHPPDCHFIKGNLQAERKIMMLKKLIALTGLEPERIQLNWAYASEIEPVAKIIDGFRSQVTMVGPSALAEESPDANILLNLRAANATAEDFRLRDLVGREGELTERENMYGERMSQAEFDALLHGIIEAEFIRHKIHLLTKEVPMSVKEIAKIADMKPAMVLRHIVNMRRRGMIALDHVKRRSPLYRALEVR